MRPTVALRGELLQSLQAVEPHRHRWDELAVLAGRPYCAPSWQLSCWRHTRTPGSLLRIVALQEADGLLVGIAPFYAERSRLGAWRYALLASEISARVEPLAVPGREREVAVALTRTLAVARPRVAQLMFRSVPAGSLWPELIASAWPGRPAWTHRDHPTSAPTVTFEHSDFPAWMKAKSGNFRQQMRRGRRQLEAQGAIFRTRPQAEELDRDLDTFFRLHHARWADKGGSSALSPGVEEALRAAGRELVGSGRFRLSSIDVGGETISSHLFLAAGSEASYWLGGFDERWATQRPSMLALVEAVEEGMRHGERRLDLGPGDQAYKYRLANGEDPLETITIIPYSPGGYARARLDFAPREVKHMINERLSPAALARLKGFLGRPDGG